MVLLLTTPKGRKLTKHSQESLRRHGFKKPWDKVDAIIDDATRIVTQADGATVYIKRAAGRGRRYDFVITDDEGIVTGMLGKTRHEMNNLARNYGWEPWF